MPKKVFTPAQIVNKLRQIERLLASGNVASMAYKRAGITEQVYRRWRKDYGGLAKRLKALESDRNAHNRDLTESLEQQTATAEILRVISSSPTDLQAVLDTVAESAGRLCESIDAQIYRLDGNILRRVAVYGEIPTGQTGEERAVDRGWLGGRAVVDRQAIHVHDLEAESEAEFPVAKAYQKRFGRARTVLAMPLLREGVPIGAITIRRTEVKPFSDKQVALLRTFADQAVIAIENVRLFNETKEALERQTATAEILKVISSSPTDLQPVFDCILDNATRLCDAHLGMLNLYDGEKHLTVAQRGASEEFTKFVMSRGQFTPPSGSALARMIAERRPIQTPDYRETAVYRDRIPNIVALVDVEGVRTFLIVPMLKEARVVGGIAIYRREVRPFTEKQIDLVRTFAAQAVIAIENVRLFKELEARNSDLSESLEQQTATAEILRVISSSPTDLQPVFDIIAESAAKLCGAEASTVTRFDGEWVHLVAVYGSSAKGVDALRRAFPRRPSGATVAARSIRDCAIAHIPDVLVDEEYGIQEAAVAGGFRAALAVPMLREGRAIGAIAIGRSEAGEFSERQVNLLRTFADQALIAIENVRIFKELEARTGALSRSVEQLTALGEVGQAISSTLDLETVLKTIVSRAVQLTGLDGGSIYEYDERAEEFRLQAAENMGPDIAEDIRKAPTRKGDGALGRTAITLEPTQIPDTLDDSYQSGRRELLIRAGYRALLAVPLLREGHLLGGLLVNRKTPGPFAPEVVELLKTFAAQSALAIQNARLFREIAEKGKQLEMASRHKSDFLSSMSHELRTPLNAILGFNEMLLGQIYGEVPADMQAPLAQIQTSGKHLLRLINNVLDLAKIEAGRMELALSDYSVHGTVESVRSTLRPLAVEKGLEFLASVPDDIPLAYGDAGRITQCLMNLAGNSLKFTKAGKVEISVELKDGTLVYRVADTGIGIPPDKIGSLFSEFKQTDATIASEYGGTGLGLSISRKFVEMHGGQIWVESELGKGSAFTFEIPLRSGVGAQA